MSSEEKTNVQSGDQLVETFVPPSDWDRKKESDTLILMLPGFRKEQLKVQVSANRVLRLSGERKISENKSRQFRMDEKLSEIYDTSGIGAKFEAGMLYVRLPKKIKQEEPSKPDQQQTTTPDQKPDSQKPSSDKKETKDQEQTAEHKQTEAQTPPLVQEPKGDYHHDENSQKKPEKEQSKASVPEEKTKTSEAKEMHETTQTALKEQEEYVQKKLTQKEEDHEDLHQKKLKQKELDDEDARKKLAQKELDDHVQKMLSQKENEKGRSGSDEGLSKRSVVKMKQWLDMVYGLVEEVKKQNKMPHFVFLIFLVLVIGLYVKSLLKSSFGGAKDQEQEF